MSSATTSLSADGRTWTYSFRDGEVSYGSTTRDGITTDWYKWQHELDEEMTVNYTHYFNGVGTTATITVDRLNEEWSYTSPCEVTQRHQSWWQLW